MGAPFSCAQRRRDAVSCVMLCAPLVLGCQLQGDISAAAMKLPGCSKGAILTNEARARSRCYAAADSRSVGQWFAVTRLRVLIEQALVAREDLAHVARAHDAIARHVQHARRAEVVRRDGAVRIAELRDRKSTRMNCSHLGIS